jgi:hypothetical protein
MNLRQTGRLSGAKSQLQKLRTGSEPKIRFVAEHAMAMPGDRGNYECCGKHGVGWTYGADSLTQLLNFGMNSRFGF